MFDHKKIYIAALVTTLLAACSDEQPVQYTDEETASETPGTTTLKRRTFLHTFRLDDAASGLELAANATTFSIDLTGCASTHTATVTQTKAYLEVYEFDRNCLAKLTTFSLNGKTYTPKAGAAFDTWLAGDVATFEVASANPADELTVTVISTIANPVVAAGEIHYQFSQVTQGATETLGEAVVRESASLVVDGQAAPNFSINQVQLVDITASGNGKFRFQLKCNNTVTGTGSDILCDDVRLDSIAMVLAEDTYALDPTETDLQAMFTAASGGKQIDMVSEAFTAGQGTPALANGGFITAGASDADVMVMAGTKPIVTYPNMIFVLKSGPSYTWFYINVTTITQSNDQ
ncbi:MAG TPA: hypothetical protein VFO10_00740 [Oligoflexus sp.]|uniref:hypothetical protein n=1 Tax=Oligoflexus sp. TaxID=1971216 RepID=UPI002D801929|nr:hypothetical protein [Oligoflexus sp.]HET9235741.1 hypothetical protein [Oligoflexus sp.]